MALAFGFNRLIQSVSFKVIPDASGHQRPRILDIQVASVSICYAYSA